ncbi:MAG: amidase family protein [Actinomycetota bacterium]
MDDTDSIPADDELCDLTAVELRRMLGERVVSAREVLAAHLARVERIDPAVNAIVTRTFDAAEDAARAADELAASGADLPTLHGLPTAHKDLLDTAGVRTTSGSTIFADHVPDADDPLVGRLREAGAISIGKTNTPEFGAGSHTFNEVFGLTRNPWDTARSAGGSSGGAAVAVACGMVPIADGSDVGGSLRNPPSFNGVVGLRPSHGVVPFTGALASRRRSATNGPIARTVADVGLFLSAMAGPYESTPWAPPVDAADYARTDVDRGRPRRVVLSKDLGGLPVDPEVRGVMRAVAEACRTLGWEVVEDDPPLDGADESFEVLRAWEYWAHLDPLLGDRVAEAKGTIRQEVARGSELSGREIAGAIAAETRILRRMAVWFADVDVLLTPTSQVAAFPADQEWVTEIDGVRFETYTAWMRSCSRITVTGHPALSLPGGMTADGRPVGVQLVGGPRGDLALLRTAAALEAVLDVSRRPPILDP